MSETTTGTAGGQPADKPQPEFDSNNGIYVYNGYTFIAGGAMSLDVKMALEEMDRRRLN